MIERMKVYAYQKDSDYVIPILGVENTYNEKHAKKCEILNKLPFIVISSKNWAV